MTDSKLCEHTSTNRLIINTNKTFEEKRLRLYKTKIYLPINLQQRLRRVRESEP